MSDELELIWYYDPTLPESEEQQSAERKRNIEDAKRTPSKISSKSPTELNCTETLEAAKS